MNSRHLTTLNLEPFLRSAIGMDRIFENTLSRIEGANTGNYPPYNIIEISDTQYEIELAVAGFNKDEIKITIDDGYLTIASDKIAEVWDEKVGDEKNYIHRGISGRSFERKFALAEYVEVVVAAVENGILTIALERNVPEVLKPKTIEIK